MTKARKTTIEIVDALTHLGFLFGLTTPIAFILSAGIYVLAGIIFAAATINFFLRRISNRMIVSIAVHMVLPAAAFVFLSLTVTNAFWIGVLVLLSLHSLWVQFRKYMDGAGFAPLCAASFIVIVIWASLAGNTGFVFIYPPLILLVITGRFILFRMQQTTRSLEAILNTSQKVKESNLHSILSFDYKLTAGLFVLLPVLSILVYFVLFSPIVGALQSFAPGLPDVDFSTTNGAQNPLDFYSTSTTPPELLTGDTPPSRLSVVVLMVITILLGSMFAVAMFALLYLLSRQLLRFLSRRKKHYNFAVDSEIIDEKEFIAPQKIQRKKQAEASNEHPIRKLFKETIIKHKKMGVPIKPTDTPKDMAKRIHSEDITDLTEAYKNIRYRG